MHLCEDLDVSDVDLLHFYLNDFVVFKHNAERLYTCLCAFVYSVGVLNCCERQRGYTGTN